MKKLISFFIVSIMVLSGLTAGVIAKDQIQKKNALRSSITSPYNDELDQSMTDYDGSLPVGRTNIFSYYANLSIAQSFIPQMEVLTRVFFLMARNASTSEPCVVAIRDNLTQEDLSIASIEPSAFPIVNGTPTEEQLAWIEFNISDIWVTSGQTYYIVVYTANVTDNYYWISGNGTNIYPNGTVYLSINDGQNWSEFTDADGCFKTYGLHETFLQIIHKGGLGPSFTVKNIGNYTAWDVIINVTISGGFVFVGKQFSLYISELPPNQEITLKPGFLVLGFGKVTISITLYAANVKEMTSTKTGMLLLFFLLGIK